MVSLLERAKAEGTPLLDRLENGMCRVTFVWQGAEPAPMLSGDFNSGTSDDPLTLQQAEPGVWMYSLELPDDAYVEYYFFLKPDIEERYYDPFNPRKVWNGINAHNNYFSGLNYKPSRLIKRGEGVKRGSITEHFVPSSPYFGERHRQVWLYRPPTDEPVPLVVVWDGWDYLSRANLNIIVDNLIAEGSIRPVALALLQNGGSSRFVEYVENEASLFFVLEKVLPLAREEINLVDEKVEPGAHGLLGASMGGLMALYGGMRYPHIFGQVLSQSGSFWIDEPNHEMLVFKLVRENPAQPIQIWQDIGRLEVGLKGNRQMHSLLQEKGYKVKYREFNGGHNFTMWADYVGEGLKFLYGS